mmetsp:Transcript_144326/g.366387  ORF Transcript_144326/g.366387 Transcript_144326/m.366387 type:complete len:371 (+) Transcript_144326:342-1454(+)
MHGPPLTRRHLVAQLARLAKQLAAEAEETEVHLRAALPIRCLELEEGRAQEIRAPIGVRAHGLEIGLDDRPVLAVAAVLADEPGRGRKVVVLLGDHVLDKVPRRLGVQAVDPARVEGLLQLGLRRAWLVVYNARIRGDGHHVLEAEGPRTEDLSVDRSQHSEGPGHGEVDAARLDPSLLLGGQDPVERGHRCLHPAPRAGGLALWRVMEEVWLVEQDEGGDGWVPRSGLLEAELKASERRLLPCLEAIVAGALLRIVCCLSVVARHDVEPDGLGVVQETRMAVPRLGAQRMVQAHRIRTESCHGPQVIAPVLTPLRRVPLLQHVLRRPAVAPAAMVRAREGAIRDTAQRLQWWQLRWRRRRHRRRRHGGR